MAFWSDIYKFFAYAFEKDPLSQRTSSDLQGAGVTQPEAIPDIRQDGSFWGGGQGTLRLRDTNDFVDLSSVTNRKSRYKEYERLRNIPEIEMVATVYADETCLSGDTKIATVKDGFVTIQKLAETKTEPFLVYCWNFEKNDYTMGWAHSPRLVKTAETIKILLDNGKCLIATPEHRILKRDGCWCEAGELTHGDELMPFYKIKARPELTHSNFKQFPRIFTFEHGWITERDAIENWKHNDRNITEQKRKIYQQRKAFSNHIKAAKVTALGSANYQTIRNNLKSEGFSIKELTWLGNKGDRRHVIGIQKGPTIPVYDLSVEEHENFCTDSLVVHNCQKNSETNNLFEIHCNDDEVKKELNFLFFNRKMLNFNKRLWNDAKNLIIMGDRFWELVIDHENPKKGILKIVALPPESVYRIETTKGKLVEFQQAVEGPDYQALTQAPITQAKEAEILQSRAIRFRPEQIVHLKIGDDRALFYPYGQSIVEPARGPAHQLRLMEDSMVVYRLSRAPERRVFYIDVSQVSSARQEAFMDRMKDQLRKKKVQSKQGGNGASAVEERWKAPAADEDYWVPIRPNTNTRIETLPGAQNLGEIDDAVYFRNKLFVALGFPKNYFATEDVQATRIALSAQDIKFARTIERIQSHIEDGLYSIAIRHLELRGYPEETYEDLLIKMTPPSDWREISRAEVVNNRIQIAAQLKSTMLISDFDLLTKFLKYTEEEAKAIISRTKIQRLEELKLQILAQNPQLMGIGVPGAADQTQLGTEAGGPAPMLAPAAQEDQPPENQPAEPQEEQPVEPEAAPQTIELLPDVTADDLKQYDLQIQTYSKEQDHEDIDFSNLT